MEQLQLYSYLYGLFGADGSVKLNNKNNIIGLVLEINEKDKDIIYAIESLLNDSSVSYRTRDTNFKKDYSSITLHCHDKNFLAYCENNGFPKVDKDKNINIPLIYSEPDFWRGVIDGDGSIGSKKVDNQPFVNLTTNSDYLKESFCDLIQKITKFRPKCNRNKRDNIYNITLHGIKALKILQYIYQDAEIFLLRKYEKYQSVASWQKKNMAGIKRQLWSKEEEDDLFKLTIQEFMQKYPNRTLVAIRGKKNKILKMKGGDANVNK